MRKEEVKKESKEKKKLNKRWIFLIVYGLVVIIAFVFIVFIAPDSMFKKDDEPVINFKLYKIEEQMQHLLNKKYTYSYSMLYTDKTGTYMNECKGSVDGNKEKGICSLPEEKEYDEKTKAEAYGNANIQLMDLEYLFGLLKDVKPTTSAYQGTAVYKYTVVIDKIETDITLMSDYENIFDIQIDNVNDHYHFKYSNIEF